MNACTYILGTNNMSKPESIIQSPGLNSSHTHYGHTHSARKPFIWENSLHSSIYIMSHNNETVTQLGGDSFRGKHVNYLLERVNNVSSSPKSSEDYSHPSCPSYPQTLMKKSTRERKVITQTPRVLLNIPASFRHWSDQSIFWTIARWINILRHMSICHLPWWIRLQAFFSFRSCPLWC